MKSAFRRGECSQMECPKRDSDKLFFCSSHSHSDEWGQGMVALKEREGHVPNENACPS